MSPFQTGGSAGVRVGGHSSVYLNRSAGESPVARFIDGAGEAPTAICGKHGIGSRARLPYAGAMDIGFALLVFLLTAVVTALFFMLKPAPGAKPPGPMLTTKHILLAFLGLLMLAGWGIYRYGGQAVSAASQHVPDEFRNWKLPILEKKRVAIEQADQIQEALRKAGRPAQ